MIQNLKQSCTRYILKKTTSTKISFFPFLNRTMTGYLVIVRLDHAYAIRHTPCPKSNLVNHTFKILQKSDKKTFSDLDKFDAVVLRNVWLNWLQILIRLVQIAYLSGIFPYSWKLLDYHHFKYTLKLLPVIISSSQISLC